MRICDTLLVFANGCKNVKEGKSTNYECCGEILELTSREMIKHMGYEAKSFENKYMCAGGIQGYKRGALAHLEVLPKVLECALQESCIAPPDSSKANHRYDQSAFSLAISSLGYTYVDMFNVCKAHNLPLFFLQLTFDVVSLGCISQL